MSAEDVKLEPCPFCGARLVHSDGLSTRRELAFVHDRDDDDPCIMASVLVMGEERAAAWNRRASRLPRQDEIRKAALEEADGWQPIGSAPKDGTVLDLWHDEFGRQADCYWGKPQHECGEAGRYCDSDWHSEPEAWIDTSFNASMFSADEFTHWRHPPAPPRALSQKGDEADG